MYLGAKMIDLIRGEGYRSMWGLWGCMGRVIAWGNRSGGERDGYLWDIRRGTIEGGGVAVCQLTAGVACKVNMGGK